MLIAGLGSSHGDDRVGWLVIDRLRERGVDATLAKVRDPTDLLSLLTGQERLLVIDACCAGGAPGTATRLVWPDARVARSVTSSTHSIDLASALRLAERLGRLPQEVVVLAVQVAAYDPCAGVSPALVRALPRLAEEVINETRAVSHA